MIQKERTYVMIKPDGVARGLMGDIISRIEKKGLKIIGMKYEIMNLNKAKEHYKEHNNKPFFNKLIEFITSGPSLSMVVEGLNAIKIMRTINGSTNPIDAQIGTIRGDYAIDIGRNIIHASDSLESSIRELSIHFRNEELLNYNNLNENYIYEI